LDSENRFSTRRTETVVDERQHPRFALDVEVKIYSSTSDLVVARTVDISAAGLAAMVKIEIPLDHVVRLQFELPPGVVSIRSLIRHRTAFRYCFKFIEPDSDAEDLIRRFCNKLALAAHDSTAQ
jgi:hypothetical protein